MGDGWLTRWKIGSTLARVFEKLIENSFIVCNQNSNFGYKFNDYPELKNEIDQVLLSLGHAFVASQELLGFSPTEAMKLKESSVLVTPKYMVPRGTDFDVFCIMPFSDSFGYIYSIIQKSVEVERQLKTGRGDYFRDGEYVMSDVCSAIYNADVCFADISGNNPNVLYEMGISHTLERIPFNLHRIRRRRSSSRIRAG